MHAKVKNLKMKSYGMRESQIEMYLHHNVSWWSARVHRSILPPRLLYWRVRSVIAFHGDKKDALTNKPLFNNRAWMKAQNILKEALMGHCSDPPNTPMFMRQLNKHG